MDIQDKYQKELWRLNIGDDPAFKETVWEYVNAMAAAPDFPQADPADRYRLLAEYGDHVLCGRNDGEHGYTFVTWRYSYDCSAVGHGHYTRNYAAAKRDFAVRAGLVRENLLFEPKQYILLQQAAAYILTENEVLSWQQETALKELLSRLEDITAELSISEPTQEPTLEI